MLHQPGPYQVATARQSLHPVAGIHEEKIRQGFLHMLLLVVFAVFVQKKIEPSGGVVGKCVGAGNGAMGGEASFTMARNAW